ncbi:hypothetical protein K469DRAFT_738638 [Zopfia rhizophila CBS 207.26]|uniref:Capsule polysaccharide biosynthesis protein n=1 Tax=Zopfia rhizophila CBS 207.26 TaxID=1314779 RepID=A0A6A6E314_9PEZI|nr:hypothetical protein K469DRAFT_738638 [Zopfia rhizophila CBS 207.26]
MDNISPKFLIPFELQDAVRFSPCTDTRSDTDILSSLNRHLPVSSERNIWTYWHSGVLSMPEWQQRNVCDWVRKCGPSWTVRVLDDVPNSPNHALKYIPQDQVPACFRDRTMDGPYVGQHSADSIRGACLYAHGGVYFDRICWEKLEDLESPFRVCASLVNGNMIANYFIAAKCDRFIKRWHEVFCGLWEEKTNYKGVSQHPLLKNLGLHWTNNELWSDKFNFDLKVDAQTLFEYTTQMDRFNGAEYWQTHVLLFDTMAETVGAEETIGWGGGGPKLFELLSLKLEADSNSVTYKEAYNMVWRILTRSSMQKIAGSKMLKTLNLDTLWSMPENKGKDREPGTFAELLRYGAVNFAQTRESPVYVGAPPPLKPAKKRHLEP